MPTHQPRLLFIDAYDSFSENIVSLLRHLLDAHIDGIKVDTDIAQTFNRPEETFLQQYHAIVLGPGPGNPLDDEDVGLYKAVWRIAAANQIPVLGICLGFQSLCATYGMDIARLAMPCHGHAKQILHEDRGMFEGLGEVVATCYNSLGVRLPSTESSRPRSPDSGYESKPVSSRTSFEIDDTDETMSGKFLHLNTLAWDDEGWVQAVEHDHLPFCGLQFHPESCKSNDACSHLLRRWWTTVTEHNATHRPDIPSGPLSRPVPQPPQLRSPSLPLQPLLDVLNRLSPILNSIDYQTVHSSASRSQIAHLCHQLSQSDRLYMLESSKKGRYSIYAVTDSSTWTLEYARGVLRIISDIIPYEHSARLDEAMNLIESFLSARLISDGPEDSPFWGGWIGYFCYELGLDLIDIKDPLADPPTREVPDYSLTWIDRSIVVDKDTGIIYVQSLRPNDDVFLTSTINHITSLTPTSPPPPSPPLDLSTTTIRLPSHALYTHQINQCLTHLHHGNSYELCLTTPATVHLPSALPTFHLHQHLLSHNPSTYSALLTLPSVTIHSLSPEQFLSWPRPTLSTPDTTLTMSPMKGTLAKTPGMTREDAKRLLGTRKEEAENLMIVDLIRHDLHRALAERPTQNSEHEGPSEQHRVTVQVEKLFELVEAETVWQLISRIVGRVSARAPAGGFSSLPSPQRSSQPQPQPTPSQHNANLSPPQQQQQQLQKHRHRTLKDAMNALRATLPPGSMTGAPKKRSCEILRALERRNRGVYAGVLGYFDVGGGGAWSVAIRCAFSAVDAGEEEEQEGKGGKSAQQAKSRRWHVAAGGAITVLSDVEGEWEEMRVKMQSVLKAFQ